MDRRRPINASTTMSTVKIISNPLKVVKVTGTFVQNSDSDTTPFYVPIIPAYLDITKGVWNMSLDSYCVKVHKPSTANLVLEISSSAVTAYEELDQTGRHVSVSAPLGHIFLFSQDGQASFGPFEKKWFTVEENSHGLYLFLKQNKLSKLPVLELDFEITVLFQRQM